MQLTKTDFKHYLDCPESLWLLKIKPEVYPTGEFSLFAQKLVAEGYEVEGYAKQLFENSVEIPEKTNVEYTQNVLNNPGKVFFQASFDTPMGCYARVDALERLADNTWRLYEIKSSSSVKKDRKHRHLEDCCFQKFVLQENGLVVSRVSIIHLNKDYIKQGEIIPANLLEISDVTNVIDNIYSGVVNQINAAITLMQKDSIDENICSCFYKTRSNHCDTFEYFNEKLSSGSVYEIKGIRENKLKLLLDQNNTNLLDVPSDFELNVGQRLQVQSYVQEEAIINQKSIKDQLEKLHFPLHFFDYETFKSAVPKLNGLNPHGQLPFQVSIHTLEEDGTLTHFEYLANELEMPSKMLEGMLNFSGITGTFVSWYASFEIGRNHDMQTWLPEHSSYLDYINTHIFDLEKIFHSDYIDWRFKGSSSIKKVLPVLVPDLSYAELDVQEGTAAMDVWERLVIKNEFEDTSEEIRENLLEYCKLDTLAMVEIYKFLREL